MIPARTWRFIGKAILATLLWLFGAVAWRAHEQQTEQRIRYEATSASVIQVIERVRRVRDISTGGPNRYRDRVDTSVAVVFETPLGRIEGESSVAACSQLGLTLKAGDQIPVFYDPEVPSRFVICRKEHSPALAIGAFIAAGLCTLWIFRTR